MILKLSGNLKEECTSSIEIQKILASGDCLFIDIWEDYTIYSQTDGTTFEYRIEKYIRGKQNSMSHFNKNYIKEIIKKQ
jgi:hypothetical protein